MSRRVALALTVVLLLDPPVGSIVLPWRWAPLHAQAGNPGEAFRDRLVEALDGGDRRQVAAMFSYPLRINVPTLPFPIPVDDATSMLQMYDMFFTPELRCAIEGSRVPQVGQPQPKYPLLTAEGVVTLGDGLVVAQQTPAGWRIARMTVIGHGGPVEGRREQVRLRGGAGQLQFGGRLSGNGTDTYTIAALQGDLLQARIERFPGRSLLMRVIELKTGNVVAGASTEYARTWAGRVPNTGDYRLEIVRRGAFCDPSVTYLLTLALRR
jgi:hypothetical protein